MKERKRREGTELVSYSRSNTHCPFIFQDLEGKNMVDELKPDVVTQTPKAEPPQCLSMAWSADGQTLFAGYSDSKIRVWQVSVTSRA